MNVDLHCHTKMTKSGDGIKRNIPSIKIFIEKLNQKKVGICAITNHNYFDVEQFKEICSYESDILFWPGIELDVEGEKSKGHCILICNPLCLNKFVDFCKKILSGSTCDNFKIKIKELVDEIKDLDLICISHYGSKKPSLNKEDQEIFYELLKGKIPFFFEPSNLRRAGILMAQNVSTLIGSDVKDWDKYEKCELPQLKIRIDSFDNFKKLLKKDDQVLRGYLNKKLKQEITISPYENCSIKLPIYDDVNVFFGGKGTGKTTILKKIEEYFSSKGISGISKYYAGEKNDIYKKLTESRFEDNDINKFEINDNLIDDFNIVLKYENPKVTPISQYVKWIDYRCKDHKFFFQEKNFSKILDLSNYERNFKQYENLCKNIKDIMNNDLFRRSNFSNIENFEKIFQEIKTGARNELYKVFCKCYVNKLFYDTINKMKKKYEKSTGFAAKPTQTGLVIMYDNLIRIHNSIKKFQVNLRKIL